VSRLVRRARRASRCRRLPAEARNRLAEEFAAHLADAVKSYRDLGLSRLRAERQALRDFGDPAPIRAGIDRAFTGRTFTLFPGSLSERLLSSAVGNLRSLLVIVAIVVLVRWQVVAAYHIPTKSMEPTLHGDPESGDMILVDKTYYRLHSPSRFEIAVFDREGEDKSLVKRIVGLSGEEIDIRDGDLFIDGVVVRKPRDVQDELLVPVYAGGRDLLADLDGEERVGLAAWTATGSWSRSDGSFRGSPDAGGTAVLAFRGEVTDDYPGGLPSGDALPVEDLVLSFRVRPAEGATTVAALLRERGDVYELSIPVGAGDAVIHRNKTEVARSPATFLRPGEEVSVRFANLDDRVSAEIDGSERMAVAIDRARDMRRDGPPAEFAVAGGPAEFGGVGLWRDIYYRREGHLPFKVPVDCCYMLGDNSGNSQDSRSWGAVPVKRLIGRPVLVFWPLPRLKLVR
jgi:signal peptidase I